MCDRFIFQNRTQKAQFKVCVQTEQDMQKSGAFDLLNGLRVLNVQNILTVAKYATWGILCVCDVQKLGATDANKLILCTQA